MKRIKKITQLLALILLPAFIFAYAPIVSVQAYDPLSDACNGNTSSALCSSRGDESSDKVKSTIKTIVETLLYFVGLLSVAMIIVSGIMYVTSSGDSGRVSRAKSTLTYSIVGLVVAFLSYAIVAFVFNKIK